MSGIIVPPKLFSSLTQLMRGVLLTYWLQPAYLRDDRCIPCNQRTGAALVSRGLAERTQVGTKTHYHLTDLGLKVVVILRARRDQERLERELLNETPQR